MLKPSVEAFVARLTQFSVVGDVSCVGFRVMKESPVGSTSTVLREWGSFSALVADACSGIRSLHPAMEAKVAHIATAPPRVFFAASRRGRRRSPWVVVLNVRKRIALQLASTVAIPRSDWRGLPTAALTELHGLASLRWGAELGKGRCPSTARAV